MAPPPQLLLVVHLSYRLAASFSCLALTSVQIVSFVNHNPKIWVTHVSPSDSSDPKTTLHWNGWAAGIWSIWSIWSLSLDHFATSLLRLTPCSLAAFSSNCVFSLGGLRSYGSAQNPKRNPLSHPGAILLGNLHAQLINLILRGHAGHAAAFDAFVTLNKKEDGPWGTCFEVLLSPKSDKGLIHVRHVGKRSYVAALCGNGLGSQSWRSWISPRLIMTTCHARIPTPNGF